VLVADHGWKLGEHGLWSKHTNFELDTRVPLILSVPGQKGAGKSCPALVETVDIYPTLCGLCGVGLPKQDLEGTSFAPLLDDPGRAWKKAVFSQHPRGPKMMGYSIRTERYRFNLWKDKTGQVLATELYDHQTDEKENANVAARAENAGAVKELTEQWQTGWKGMGPT
jgi:arylsulfatase A-like enzyme